MAEKLVLRPVNGSCKLTALIGTLINIGAITIGSAAGIVAGGGLKEGTRAVLLTALGAVTLVYGVSMGLKTVNILVPLVGLVLGAVIGCALRLDERLDRLGEYLKSRFASGGQHSKFVEGFTAASILFCIGPMAVLGSFEDGLGQGYKTLAIKSVLDCVASAALASGLGIGVWFSVVTVLVVQGSLTLAASAISPYVTDAMIGELSACGGYMLIIIGLGLAGATKAKATNLLPGLLLTPFLVLILDSTGIKWAF